MSFTTEACVLTLGLLERCFRLPLWDRTGLVWLRIGPSGGLLWTRRNESSGSIKFGKFLDSLRNSKLRKKDPAPRGSVSRMAIQLAEGSSYGLVRGRSYPGSCLGGTRETKRVSQDVYFALLSQKEWKCDKRKDFRPSRLRCDQIRSSTVLFSSACIYKFTIIDGWCILLPYTRQNIHPVRACSACFLVYRRPYGLHNTQIKIFFKTHTVHVSWIALSVQWQLRAGRSESKGWFPSGGLRFLY